MERDKKIAVTLAVIIGIILLGCTVASQIIYQKLLPQVRCVDAVWQEDGYRLPKDAIFMSRNGTCIFYVEEVSDQYQTRYVLKEVLITIVREEEQHLIVRGIYNPEWRYAAGTDVALENGMEVKIVQYDIQ